MRYIISGGGTGGHIYPALSVLEQIKKTDPKAKVLYVGTKDSLEERLATKAGYDFNAVTVKGMPRNISIKSLKSGFALLKGLMEARNIIKYFKPDVVIGTGGYVSFPIVFMAQRAGISTYIQEQNAFPGKANRFLAKKADGVFIAFEDAKDRLTTKSIYNTGNPIDDKYNKIDKEQARSVMDLDPGDKLVVSFGGSGGQESINDAVLEILEKGLDPNIKLIHITGTDHYDYFNEEIKNRGIKITDNVEIMDYTHQMPLLLASSDLVIMSSSAISLAEIAALNKKTILIPKSYTADNHQVYNARAHAKENVSKIILEQNLTGESLLESIVEYLDIDHEESRVNKNTAAIDIVDIFTRDLNEKKKLQ